MLLNTYQHDTAYLSGLQKLDKFKTLKIYLWVDNIFIDIIVCIIFFQGDQSVQLYEFDNNKLQTCESLCR